MFFLGPCLVFELLQLVLRGSQSYPSAFTAAILDVAVLLQLPNKLFSVQGGNKLVVTGQLHRARGQAVALEQTTAHHEDALARLLLLCPRMALEARDLLRRRHRNPNTLFALPLDVALVCELADRRSAVQASEDGAVIENRELRRHQPVSLHVAVGDGEDMLAGVVLLSPMVLLQLLQFRLVGRGRCSVRGRVPGRIVCPIPDNASVGAQFAVHLAPADGGSDVL
mmetsp:Transcript_124003/g.355975  ORF Transcript_124003/g.355975 Transcript_124003/m.355975 type:complete len:225 (+) Transcript_124003:3065-3739(+)